jgi:hypothetical protein
LASARAARISSGVKLIWVRWRSRPSSLGSGARVAAHLHELVANSLRRHEAQHGLDHEHPSQLAYPAELAAHLGPLEDRDRKPRPDAALTRAELSAYLSQIANDPVTPQLEYWHVTSVAFDDHVWGWRSLTPACCHRGPRPPPADRGERAADPRRRGRSGLPR